MILLVTLCYSTTSGLRSVVNTDIVQFVLAMTASAVFAWFVVDRVGGLDQMLALLHDRFPDGSDGMITASQILSFTPSQAKDVSLTVLLVIALQWLLQMNADGTGYLAQRTMACRSDRDATHAAIVFTVAQVLLRSLIWVPLGLGLLVLFPIDPQLSLDQLSADRAYSFVRGMSEVLPPGLLGLMLTGMVAAFASTVDTQLNWGQDTGRTICITGFSAVGCSDACRPIKNLCGLRASVPTSLSHWVCIGLINLRILP